ncbi:MAG TPA: hypothetical protein PLF59_08145 [Cyclobacteriaceae bacterium]|nr:hypothetical protein [Cyclobacteriaceae bacterium]
MTDSNSLELLEDEDVQPANSEAVNPVLEKVDESSSFEDLDCESAEEVQAEVVRMVEAVFMADSLFFTPGEDGKPQPNFYKKNRVILVEEKVFEQMLVQNLKLEVKVEG